MGNILFVDSIAMLTASSDVLVSTLKKDYNRGKEKFSFFQCKNMLDYFHLYCRLDTILLGEVMTTFRQQMFKHFELDCTAYISFPQLAFDCCLKTLSEPIELMHDPDMVLMIEHNVRGGVSFITERQIIQNNR